jgi:hypothetical protein
MIYRYIFFLFIIILFGCSHNKEKNAITQKTKDTAKAKNTSKKITHADTVARYTGPDDTVPKVSVPEGAIQIITDNQPVDTINRAYYLESVNLDSGEIEPTEMKLHWKGVFERKDGSAYVKDVRLKFERAESETDEDGKKTGWLVTGDNKDEGFYLSGIDDITDGPFKLVKLNKTTLYPGEMAEFNYNGVAYTFYAKGFKKDGDIYNYRLYLLANVKGHYFNQLLASEDHFGDEMHWEEDATISIAFVGDIDGDKIPDVVIERGAEFEGDSQLFLSKAAGDNAILKHITGFGQSD